MSPYGRLQSILYPVEIGSNGRTSDLRTGFLHELGRFPKMTVELMHAPNREVIVQLPLDAS